MFSLRHVHRLVFGLSLFALICLTIGGLSYLTWNGMFGAEAQAYLQNTINPYFPLLPSNETLDRAANILGALGTAAGAVWGVARGLHYAEASLPERMRDALRDSEKALITSREPLFAALNAPNTNMTVPQSAFFVAPLQDAIESVRSADNETARRLLDQAITDIDAKLEVAKAQAESLTQQKATSHILRGKIVAALAGSSGTPFEVAHADRRAAEADFTHVIDFIDESDLDALEARGRQREVLEHVDGAMEDYVALEKAAHQENDALRTARALRLQGMLIQKGATTTARSEARKKN